MDSHWICKVTNNLFFYQHGFRQVYVSYVLLLNMASNKTILASIQCETNLSSEIDHLSNQIDATFQQIEEKANTSRIVYNNVITSFDDWRTQELKRIDQIYQNHLRSIDVQQAELNKFYQNLKNDLKYNATQHLERVQKQESSNIQVLNQVHQTIARVRYSVAHPQRHLTIRLPNDIEFSSSDFPSN